MTDTYEYDKAGRVDAVNNVKVLYDPNGNRLGVGSATTSFRADNSIAVDAGRPASYTPSGELVSDGCNTNAFDGFGRLSGQTAAGCGRTDSVAVAYDGLGRPVKATTSGGRTETRWLRHLGLGQAVLAEDTGTASTTARYTTGPSGSPLSVTDGAASRQVLVGDGHGTVGLALNGTTPACIVDTDLWGSARQPTSLANPCRAGGSSPNTRWFQGARREAATGAYGFGARTYNPATATWLSPDSHRASAPGADLSVGVDPLTANRHSYVNGDPVNFADPTGHNATDDDAPCGPPPASHGPPESTPSAGMPVRCYVPGAVAAPAPAPETGPNTEACRTARANLGGNENPPATLEFGSVNAACADGPYEPQGVLGALASFAPGVDTFKCVMNLLQNRLTSHCIEPATFVAGFAFSRAAKVVDWAADGARTADRANDARRGTKATTAATKASKSSDDVARGAAARVADDAVVAPQAIGTAEDAPGIVYRRLDQAGGKPYVGQSVNEERFLIRQSEHARRHPNADFEFEILGRANPGNELDRLEEFYIRQGGGPTTRRNPDGGLANRRHQMSDDRYAASGGAF